MIQERATEIRYETSSDLAGIRDVNREAFAGPTEAKLVDVLRNRTHCISLVALSDTALVGHILFTAVEVHGESAKVKVAGLGPMAVLPAWQRRGIGLQLVRDGLEECGRCGYEAVVVLGHPGYYPRFGFVPASRFGLRCEFEAPDEAFMALELRSGALRKGGGLVKYAPAFSEG